MLNIQEASTQGQASSREQGMTDENGSINKVVPQDAPSADLLGDLLGPLAIEGPQVPTVPGEQKDKNLLSALEATPEEAGPLALATVDDQPNSVQVSYYVLSLYGNDCLFFWYLFFLFCHRACVITTFTSENLLYKLELLESLCNNSILVILCFSCNLMCVFTANCEHC